MQIYQITLDKPLDLCIAKVEYLRLTDTDSEEKEKALDTARQAVQSSDDSAKFLLKLIQYYIDSSQYRHSIKACEQVRQLIDEKRASLHYLPKIHDLLGITYYYLFDFRKASINLQKACELAEQHEDFHTLGEALHYLGRVHIEQGDLHSAMENFIAANSYQQNNLADSAWYHLRLGNLLVRANLLPEAYDHISKAQELFHHIQYGGSALVQVELAWADIHKAEKNYKLAESHILRSIEFAKETGFYRGELLCIVKLFWTQLIHLHRLDNAIQTFFRGIANREVWRNAGLKLILKYLLRVLLIPFKWIAKSPYSIAGTADVHVEVSECTCPIHNGDRLRGDK